MLATTTRATQGHASCAAVLRRDPALTHQAGAYCQPIHATARIVTGQGARTPRLMPPKAAGPGPPLRSMPATGAGSPPIRSGVNAQAASPNALRMKVSLAV